MKNFAFSWITFVVLLRLMLWYKELINAEIIKVKTQKHGFKSF